MRIAAIGDNVLDTYVDLGLAAPGGNALNVAVFARRLGADAAYLGAIGDDTPGELIAEALRAEGVDISRLRVVSGPTAHAIVRHVGSDRFFGTGSHGVSEISLNGGDLEFLAGFDVVHSGYAGGLESSAAVIAERSAFSYDFADIDDEAVIEAVAPNCWLATFSATHLGDAARRSRIEAVLDLGAKHVLITRGDQGAVLATQEGVVAVDAVPVQVVDTLGAGDAFIATTIVGLLNGDDPRRVLATAAASAAAVCTHYSAFGHVIELSQTSPTHDGTDATTPG